MSLEHFSEHTALKKLRVRSDLHHPSREHSLFVVGVNHRSAPIAVQEALHFQPEKAAELVRILPANLSEYLTISTCNRTELYGVVHTREVDTEYFKRLLMQIGNQRNTVERSHLYDFVGECAVEHVFRVASGIDSKIIGDGQILGQLRRAYEAALESGTTGKILNQLFQHAFRVGKRVRTETNLHKINSSVASAAVRLAKETAGPLNGKTALIIGAGETARLAAQSLINARIGTIIVANRSSFHAEQLLSKLKDSSGITMERIELSDFPARIGDADVVVSAIGSTEPVLLKHHVADRDGDLFVIDLGMPRNVMPDVSECPFVTLRNLDDVSSLAGQNYQSTIAELPKVETIVREEISGFQDWYRSLAQPVGRVHSARVGAFAT